MRLLGRVEVGVLDSIGVSSFGAFSMMVAGTVFLILAGSFVLMKAEGLEMKELAGDLVE